jgi:hypothetical protein
LVEYRTGEGRGRGRVEGYDLDGYVLLNGRTVVDRDVRRVWPIPGHCYRAEMPYSEVCMHMRVAGTFMVIRLADADCVQLLDRRGRDFSVPILAAEAGLYRSADGWWFEYKTESPDRRHAGA